MSSPILEYIYQYTGIDAAYIILALAVLVMILLIVMIVVLCKQKKLYRKYEIFMKGKEAESLEEALLSCIERSSDIDKMNRMMQEDMVGVRKTQRMTYQKMGIVKYNAFREMTGDLSYVLVLLDQEENGFILNSVYAKEGSYSYIKEVVSGECEITLSEEEKEALGKAKNRS